MQFTQNGRRGDIHERRKVSAARVADAFLIARGRCWRLMGADAQIPSERNGRKDAD